MASAYAQQLNDEFASVQQTAGELISQLERLDERLRNINPNDPNAQEELDNIKQERASVANFGNSTVIPEYERLVKLYNNLNPSDESDVKQSYELTKLVVTNATVLSNSIKNDIPNTQKYIEESIKAQTTVNLPQEAVGDTTNVVNLPQEAVGDTIPISLRDKSSLSTPSSSAWLRDYTHASKIFRSSNYNNAPKYKFLFHVYFDINPNIYNLYGIETVPNFGVLVKSIRLPQFNVVTHTMNQYNRKRIVQSKIRYESTDVSFHDDNGNVIRDLWKSYYSYYFADSRNTDSTNNTPNSSNQISYDFTRRTLYDPFNPDVNQHWGYTGVGNTFGTKEPFFKNIIIYGLYQNTKYVAYTLVNPIITSFRHDSYNYGDNTGIMENTMAFDYEFVKYDEGEYTALSVENGIYKLLESSTYDLTSSQNTGYYNSRRNSSDNVSKSDRLNRGVTVAQNTAYNAYKNQPTPVPTTVPINAALNNTVTNSVNRNTNFSTPAYGSTPSNIGVAGSTNTNIEQPISVTTTTTQTTFDIIIPPTANNPRISSTTSNADY